jgi:predicted nucleotidyltransferase
MTMTDTAPFKISAGELTEFCRRYGVRELALFGSMLNGSHDSESDIDLLVSFEPSAHVTFLTLAKTQRELETLLGKPVDLVPKNGLKPLIREQVLASARVLYAA